MDGLDELERAAGLDPDSPNSRLRKQLAEADDELIERLVQMRKDKGLTQKVVAERMKRDVAAVSNFERLRADPHLSTIRRYAAAIGASITHQVVDVDVDASAGEERPGSLNASRAINLETLVSRFPQSQGADELLIEFSEAWARQPHRLGEAPEATAEHLRAFLLKFMTDKRGPVGTRRS